MQGDTKITRLISICSRNVQHWLRGVVYVAWDLGGLQVRTWPPGDRAAPYHVSSTFQRQVKDIWMPQDARDIVSPM